MANQGAPNNQPRPARDTHVSGGKMLTGARCSLSQMPPTRFTAHQALIKILADDSEYIGASDYRNGSDFESEIVRIRVMIATVGLNQMPTVTQPHACQSSRGQVHGRRHGTGWFAQSEMGHGAATNVGPCANRDNVDSDNSRNNKTKKHLKQFFFN